MLRKLIFSLIAILVPISGYSAEITVTDASIVSGKTVNWTKKNTYILDHWVFVDSLATLNIEAGTIIKGMPGAAENSSALIVCRGGKIFAEGTKDEPIIFTALTDDVNDPTDLPLDSNGLWGGIIILGNATNNLVGGQGHIEGIDPLELRGWYGGTDDHDNSGVLKYVSIRHAGTEIGAGNEINGLTLGSVGDGTTIENIEVFCNYDDGIEFFGGTVNTKYIISAFCGDDCFDWDQGYRGKNQFWFAIQGWGETHNRFVEMDGGESPKDALPYSTASVFNATFIGAGKTSVFAESQGLKFRECSGGFFNNCIFTDSPGFGVDIENKITNDSNVMLTNGNLALNNNIWWNFGKGDTFLAIANNKDYTATHLSNNNNVISDPLLGSISRTNDHGLDPRPKNGGAAYQNLYANPNDGFFSQTDYKGAFGTQNWADGWTALSKYGFFNYAPSGIVVTDNDILPGQTVRWTKNNTYVLDHWVFVDSLATLIIEPGTVIKGMPGAAENSSALIVCRGGKIFAEGTKDEPIIFTALTDDVNDPTDLPLDSNGLWGGLIVLGKATNNLVGGQGHIEGIDPLELRGWYGGTDDHDNSGVLKYISIRHAGTEIGAGNEINGLTLGSVGDGTTIEYIEVFCNYDDGIEFFGGTVNTKYVVSAFSGDDCFDWDQGYRGKNQFWFAIQGWGETHNRFVEMDGGESPKDAMPYSTASVFNATFIGAGKTSVFAESQGLKFRECSGGFFNNCIFTDSPGFGVDIENKITNDSNVMLANGNLALNNNIWWNFGVGDTFLAIANNKDYTATHLSNSNNVMSNPLLGSISRTNNGALDPRPSTGGPAFKNLAVLPDDDFYSITNFKGAFGTQLWLDGWTALSKYGFTPYNPNDDIIISVDEEKSLPSEYALVQNYPNPFNPSTTISFTIPSNSAVKIEVFDMVGQKVDTLVNSKMNPGTYSIVWNASDCSSGVYFYKLTSGTTNITKKMLFIK